PKATATAAPKMPRNPRYCPTRMRRVVPGCPWPRAKNSDRMTTSSMLVAINRPIACTMEEITRSAPHHERNRQQCRPDQCKGQLRQRPGSCPPTRSVPEPSVGLRSHSGFGVPDAVRPQCHSRANRPDGWIHWKGSAQDRGQALPDIQAPPTASTEFGTVSDRPWLDPTGASYLNEQH